MGANGHPLVASGLDGRFLAQCPQCTSVNSTRHKIAELAERWWTDQNREVNNERGTTDHTVRKIFVAGGNTTVVVGGKP